MEEVQHILCIHFTDEPIAHQKLNIIPSQNIFTVDDKHTLSKDKKKFQKKIQRNIVIYAWFNLHNLITIRKNRKNRNTIQLFMQKTMYKLNVLVTINTQYGAGVTEHGFYV